MPVDVQLHGRRFVRAETEWPYPGVVAQYREDRETHSWHLKVLENGTYVIDHSDCFNPDYGFTNKILHVLEDTSVGPYAKVGVAVGGVLAVIVGIGLVSR